MHIYCVHDYKKIVEEQVKKIENSGLLDAVEKIWYVVVGDNGFRINGDKYQLLAQSSNMKLTENFTINMLRTEVLLNMTDDYKVFYIHTKGVTRQKKSIYLWRIYMEYFNITMWLHCVDALFHADAVGVNRRIYQKTRVHFSGNFWWARASYLKTLPQLSVEGYGREVNRWDGEFWIGDGNPNVVTLWQSRVHHPRTQYGPNMYRDKSPMMKFLKKR